MNRPLLGGVNHGEKWELAEIVIASADSADTVFAHQYSGMQIVK